MTWTIGLDWGTSRLRALLFDDGGRVHEERMRDWGIRHLPAGGFDAALADICAGWPQAIAMFACGMVGSRQGWREAPYVDTPSGIEDLGKTLSVLETAAGRTLHIVPGVRDGRRPDVMRGEETQVFGALHAHPELAVNAQLILPGTHSKWVRVQDARITGFATMMTGELYALLRRHSILGTGDHAGETASSVERDAAFALGVEAARDSGSAGALSRLFTTRVLMLEGRLAAACVVDYLSGLLIGEEWRAAQCAGWYTQATPIALIGDAALCARYQHAATLFGRPKPMLVTDASAHGLWQIACRANAMSSTTSSIPEIH